MLLFKIHRKLATAEVWPQLFDVHERERVERFDAEPATVAAEPVAHGPAQRKVVSARGLELNDERRLVFKERQNLVQKRHRLSCALEAVLRELPAREIFNLNVRARRAQKA